MDAHHLEAQRADEGLSWYLIHCKPREERRALENLERQHFECFFPVRSRERRREGKLYKATDPLFPGYLFIHLNRLQDNWYPIRSTRGVNGIVRFSEYPLPVRDDLIEGIKIRLSDSPVQEPYLRPGDNVRITEGAFSQLEAIFLSNDGDQRVILLLNILQSEQALSFPLTSVRKVATH
jgi:transcriptional antiterminator RfaH